MHKWIHSVGVRAKGILLPRRLAQLLPASGTLKIVQIGSNDGKSGDPFHNLIRRRNEWQALFVEPVPYLYQRLKQCYGEDGRFLYENSAIGLTSGRCQFYHVNPCARINHPELPEWVEQLGSFSRCYVEKHFPEILTPYIEEIVVPTASLSDVLTKHGMGGMDALHIDTEGYDYEVLRQVEFEHHRPCVVLFEHKHLSEVDCKASRDLMLQHGYSIEKWGGDYLCSLDR